MREGSDFVFESVDLLSYSLHKIGLNGVAPYKDSPDWIKHKKATINSKSKDKKCFRDATTAALNHEKYLITQKEYIILGIFWSI